MAFIKYTTGQVNPIIEYMECKCMSPEHLVRFHLDTVDGDLCLDFHLDTYLPWYKRAWRGLKYLFGYKSKYGDFDELLFKEDDLVKLQEILKYQKEIKDRILKNEGI